MDLKKQSALMQAATDYADKGATHLETVLGHPPSEQDMVVFTSAVASMMGSWVYAKLYEGAGREHADTWMQQIFVQLGMAVKGRGVPVTLQISLKSIPTESAAAVQPPVVQETSPIVICKCVLDDKGNCHGCTKTLIEDLTSLVTYTEKLETFQKDFQDKAKRCQPCVNKAFDIAFAKVIREEMKRISPTMRDMIVAMAVQGASMHGVTYIPEVEKALEETSKA